MTQIHIGWSEDRSIRGHGNHRISLGCADESRSFCVHAYMRVKNDCVSRQVPQALEKSGHVKIGEVSEIQAGFVDVEALSIDCFQVLVVRGNTAHDN